MDQQHKPKGLNRTSSGSSLSLISSSSVESRAVSGDEDGAVKAQLSDMPESAVLHTGPSGTFTDKQLADLNLQVPIKTGWLKKCTDSSTGVWKKRWFVLRGDNLGYYKDNKEYKVLGIFMLQDIVTVAEVRIKQKENVFAAVTAEKTVFLQCATKDDLKDWVKVFRRQWKQVKAAAQSSSLDMSPMGHQRIESEYDKTKMMQQRNQIQSDNRALIEGVLEKLRTSGFNANTWAKKWIVLRNGQLNIYNDDKEYLLKRLVPLTAVLGIVPIDPISKSHEFCFKIILPRRTITLCASSEKERNLWVETLATVHKQMVKNCITDEGLESDSEA